MAILFVSNLRYFYVCDEEDVVVLCLVSCVLSWMPVFVIYVYKKEREVVKKIMPACECGSMYVDVVVWSH